MAVLIVKVMVAEEPVPEYAIVKRLFAVPWLVVVPTDDTNEQDEK